MKRNYLIGLFLLAIAIFATQWTVQRVRKPGQSNMIESLAMDMNSMQPEIGKVPVGIEKVSLRQVQSELNYSGTLKGYNEVNIAARVEGVLSQVPVYVGSRVQQGQLLARIQAPELAVQTQIAQSEQLQLKQDLNVLNQESQRLQAEQDALATDLKAAQAEVSAAEANAQYWRERLPREQSLHQSGALPLEELQRYQADANMAQAELRSKAQKAQNVRAQQRIKQTQINELKARSRSQHIGVERAGISVRERQIWQGLTQIKAPFSGVITQRWLAPGSVVMVASPIVTLAQIDPIRVQIPVAAADLAELVVGSRLRVQLPGGVSSKTPEIETRISSISPASAPGSRTHLLEALIANPGGKFLPGQYVSVRVFSGAEQAAQPAIPERALVQLGGEDYVWLMRDQRAHLQKITVKALNGDWVWVKGLNRDQDVITDNYENLQEGMAVAAVKWTENGPQELPQAGGLQRLNEANHWQIMLHLEDLQVQIKLEPQPSVSGENTLRFELKQAGQAVKDAKISLNTSMPSMNNMPGPRLSANAQSEGVYTARFSGMGGLWQVSALIETAGKRLKPIVFEFNLP